MGQDRPLLYGKLFGGPPPPLPAAQRKRVRALAGKLFAWDEASGEELLEPGTRWGRWRVERVLGGGGQSVVYRVRHLVERDRVAALKVPREGRAQRLLDEGEVLRRLDHPGIVTLLEAPTPEAPELLLEYCSGGSLAERLQVEGGLPEAEVLRIALELLAALEHAHQSWILHRDLKPSNILFTRDGTVKIIDFGVGHHLTEQGVGGGPGLVGTPLYLAPEQESPSGRVDERSDLYAFGKVLYAMLVARCPRTLRPVERVRPELGPLWSDVVFQLTEFEPADRYASARAVREALEELAAARELRPAPRGCPEDEPEEADEEEAPPPKSWWRRLLRLPS